ncbi:MAG: hypothetical protein IJU44_01150 [Kiritimatiellae bacterium]|nr:hypothetical protein [Kiritimatiellia bacterium]
MKEKEPVYNIEVTPFARWIAAGFDTSLSFVIGPESTHSRYSELLSLACLIALPLTISVCVGGSAALWLVCRILSAAINRMRRPKYYERERLRRRELRAQRRKITPRSTLNPCPSPERLSELWANRKRSEADMVRLGSALLDLDAFVDNSLCFDEDGRICGRNPGVKGWLFEHCPDIWSHYKTAMRYKQLAVKLRQAVGLADPYPAEAALCEEDGGDLDKTTLRNDNDTAGCVDAPQGSGKMRPCCGMAQGRVRDMAMDGELTPNENIRLCGGINNGGGLTSDRELSPKVKFSPKNRVSPEGKVSLESKFSPGWEFARGPGAANNLALARAVAREVLAGRGGMSGMMSRLDRRLDENFGLKKIGPSE